jgi:hypothetical protein
VLGGIAGAALERRLDTAEAGGVREHPDGVTTAPAGNRRIAAVAAAIPDENVSARPRSRAPMTSSSAAQGACPSRAYPAVPPACNADAGVIGTFNGPSATAAGRPRPMTCVSGRCPRLTCLS